MAKLSVAVLGLAMVSGCASSEGDVAPVPSAKGAEPSDRVDAASILEALALGSMGAATRLDGVRWVEAGGVAEDPSEVRAKLIGLVAAARGRKVDKHHAVARLTLGGGTFVYAGPSVGGSGVDVVLFEAGAGVLPTRGIESVYADSWNGADRAVRDARLARAFEASGKYVDPRIQASDRAALSDAIASFREAPGVPDLLLVGPTQAVAGGYVTFGWAIGDSPGIDVAHVSSGGKLDQVVGFY